jgi:hypothetical protein
MSQADKIFTLRTPAGAEVLSVDAEGNFYVRGTATDSNENVRLIMLEFAKQFLLERVRTAPVLTIRSTIPDVLRQFATAESRETDAFRVALLNAGQRPLVDFNFQPGLVNTHVFVGLLQDAAQQALRMMAAEAARSAAAPAPDAPTEPLAEEPTTAPETTEAESADTLATEVAELVEAAAAPAPAKAPAPKPAAKPAGAPRPKKRKGGR